MRGNQVPSLLRTFRRCQILFGPAQTGRSSPCWAWLLPPDVVSAYGYEYHDVSHISTPGFTICSYVLCFMFHFFIFFPGYYIIYVPTFSVVHSRVLMAISSPTPSNMSSMSFSPYLPLCTSINGNAVPCLSLALSSWVSCRRSPRPLWRLGYSRCFSCIGHQRPSSRGQGNHCYLFVSSFAISIGPVSWTVQFFFRRIF